MYTGNLRKVGESVMLTVPPDLLNSCYTLDELLAVSDYSQPQPPEEREWVDAPAVGRELHLPGIA